VHLSALLALFLGKLATLLVRERSLGTSWLLLLLLGQGLLLSRRAIVIFIGIVAATNEALCLSTSTCRGTASMAARSMALFGSCGADGITQYRWHPRCRQYRACHSADQAAVTSRFARMASATTTR